MTPEASEAIAAEVGVSANAVILLRYLMGSGPARADQVPGWLQQYLTPLVDAKLLRVVHPQTYVVITDADGQTTQRAFALLRGLEVQQALEKMTE